MATPMRRARSVCILWLAGALSACGSEPPPPPVWGAFRTPGGKVIDTRLWGSDGTVRHVAHDEATGRWRRLHVGRRWPPPLGATETAYLWVAGHEPVRLSPDDLPPHELVPGIPVRLHVGVTLPEPDLRLFLTFLWRGDGSRPDALLRRGFQAAAPVGWVDQAGDLGGDDAPIALRQGQQTVSVLLSEAGAYRVNWALGRVRGGNGVWSTYSVTVPHHAIPVRIRETEEPQDIHLDIPPREFEEALRLMLD